MSEIELFLEIHANADLCLAPVETIIALFVLKYCDSDILVTLVRTPKKIEECAYSIDITSFVYRTVELDEIPSFASSCQLPNIILDESTCIAGLCATLRQIVKTTVAKMPDHPCKSLLGFKDACLLSCAESSIWTKFCEVDLIHTLKFLSIEVLGKSEIPSNLARFECHMSQPVRLHNLYKYTMSKRWTTNSMRNKENNAILEHNYAEGPNVTLADVIIFVCVHIFFALTSSSNSTELVPLTLRWYERMKSIDLISSCLQCLNLSRLANDMVVKYVLPIIENQSLYKSDPKRYKPRSRIYTRQSDLDASLKIISGLEIDARLDPEPVGSTVTINWEEIPFGATPEGGSLPASRLKRKFEQLENLCRPVIKLAKSGDVIVDFCSGSGHLGILIAYLLPDCQIILLENKEESLNRAKKRVEKLELANVLFYQCNLDYFKGHFDIGVSLHACGVATDLVIQHCIRRSAIFVCCPCCYGSVHDCHHITYPRSEIFRSKMDNRSYLILGHCADQTHDKNNAKTEQGYKCMTIIDTDRKLQAEQFSYTVHLAKLVPEECTPKNHLLVGIPQNRSTAQP